MGLRGCGFGGTEDTISQRIRGNRSLCFLPLAQLSRREHRARYVGGWWGWGVKVPMVMTPSCASWAGQPGGCSQSTRGTPGVPGTSGRGCEAGKRDGSRSFPLHLSPARSWGHFPSKGCDFFVFQESQVVVEMSLIKPRYTIMR